MNDDDARRIAHAVVDELAKRLGAPQAPTQAPRAPSAPVAVVPPYEDKAQPDATYGDLLDDVVESAASTVEDVQALLGKVSQSKGRDKALSLMRELGLSTKAKLASAPQADIDKAVTRLKKEE